MIYSKFRPHIDQEVLEGLLDGMIESRIASLPKPLKELANGLRRSSSSSEVLEQRLFEFAVLAIDWSRAGPTSQGISADYCPCILCGQRMANKRGIMDHLHGSRCDVFRAIDIWARAKFCETRAWQQEVAARRKAQAEEARTLCVVDINRGPELIHAIYNRRSDLMSIEPRLKGMGFKKVVRKLSGGRSETRWEMTTDTAYVLADPREAGRIYLRAWPLDQLSGDTNIPHLYSAPEYILDSWKHDLPSKVRTRIAKQLAARWAAQQPLSVFQVKEQQACLPRR